MHLGFAGQLMAECIDSKEIKLAPPPLATAYDDYTDKALLSLHHGIAMSCANDRTLTTAQKEAAQNFGSPLLYFGVDVFLDWKAHGDALELVLTKRGIGFTALKF